MNIFGRKFAPPKTPPRRSLSLNNLKRTSDLSMEEIANEFDKIKMNLGNKKARFKNGQWITDGQKEDLSLENLSLKKELKETMEENNLLKVKVEILLDMLTEKSAENLLKDKELTYLKSSYD